MAGISAIWSVKYLQLKNFDPVSIFLIFFLLIIKSLLPIHAEKIKIFSSDTSNWSSKALDMKCFAWNDNENIQI